MLFCTIANVAAFLQVAIAEDHEPYAEQAIRAATAAIQSYCEQRIERVEDDEIWLDGYGGSILFLPELPVVAVSQVVEGGVTLTASDYTLGQHGMLHRARGPWSRGVQNIRVTYTHGYAPIPDQIVSICTRAAAREYQAGLRAAEMGGVAGVQATSLGDYAVQYGGEQSAYREGQMGASGAPILLRSEKEALARYRVR